MAKALPFVLSALVILTAVLSVIQTSAQEATESGSVPTVVPTPIPPDPAEGFLPLELKPTPPELLTPFEEPCEVPGSERRTLSDSPYPGFTEAEYDKCGNLVAISNPQTGVKIINAR
jgi:hypothetical protein